MHKGEELGLTSILAFDKCIGHAGVQITFRFNLLYI